MDPSARHDYDGPPLDVAGLADDPVAQFEAWFGDAIAAGVFEPEAMVVATVADGFPSARWVLLRGHDSRGFVFYTNLDSRKSQEIAANPSVALAWHWPELARQVRVEGIASLVEDTEADAYFASRPLVSRLGAWASPQSAVIPDRPALEKLFEAVAERFGVDDAARRGERACDIPRPPRWSGWRVTPVVAEFWQGRPGRLHDRFRYRRDGDAWVRERLAP